MGTFRVWRWLVILLTLSGGVAARAVGAQTITGFPVPDAGNVITTGPDGTLWFTELHANKIGRITTAGVVTEFPIPTLNSFPRGIVAGPDGALWFTESNACKIGRITTAGVATEYAIPTVTSGFAGIATGPDGALWFTEPGANKIGRISTNDLEPVPLPTPIGQHPRLVPFRQE